MMPENKPEVVVTRDWDGYFERLVKGWVEQKTGPFKHSKICVTGMPYQAAAVILHEIKGEESTLVVSFYPAIRNGFGSLSEAEIGQIIAML